MRNLSRLRVILDVPVAHSLQLVSEGNALNRGTESQFMLRSSSRCGECVSSAQQTALERNSAAT